MYNYVIVCIKSACEHMDLIIPKLYKSKRNTKNGA